MDESLMNCPHARRVKLRSSTRLPTSAMPSSAAAGAEGSSTSVRAVRSIIWNFPPTSYSRLYSADYVISSACATWPRCSCCAVSNSPTKRSGSGKSASHSCLPIPCEPKGKGGRRWYVDETYLKVKRKWCYLYRAIDREGNLVDSMLSETRDMAAAFGAESSP